MNEEYTEEDLRGCAAGDSPYSCMDEEVIDRIIAKIKADAWDEGVKAAVDADCYNPPCGCCDGCYTILVNPYERKTN